MSLTDDVVGFRQKEDIENSGLCQNLESGQEPGRPSLPLHPLSPALAGTALLRIGNTRTMQARGIAKGAHAMQRRERPEEAIRGAANR